jgi:hypothetical protein
LCAPRQPRAAARRVQRHAGPPPAANAGDRRQPAATPCRRRTHVLSPRAVRPAESAVTWRGVSGVK